MHKFQQSKSPAFFALLSLPSTAMGFALSIQISALSWILTTQYQLDIHDVGLVWAAGPLAGILGQVIIGVISDKVWFWNGRRRPFILIGGMLAALMLLALPNLDVISANLGVGGILGVAIAVALLLSLTKLLQVIVVAPLRRLTRHAIDIGESEHPTARLRSKRAASTTTTVTSGWPNSTKSRAISSSVLVASSE